VGVVPTLRRWLSDEVRSRLGVEAAWKWDVKSWPLLSNAGLPEQLDGGSCGVFVLAAADCYSLGRPLDFEQADMPALCYCVALSLFFDDLRCSAGLPIAAGLGLTSSDDGGEEDVLPLRNDASAEENRTAGDSTDGDVKAEQGVGEGDDEGMGSDADNAADSAGGRRYEEDGGWGEVPFEWDHDGEDVDMNDAGVDVK